MPKNFFYLAVALGLAATPLPAEEAKVNFAAKCAICHGKEGKGDTTMGRRLGTRDFTDPKVQATLKEAESFRTIKEGIKKGDTVLMQPFAAKLSDDEIKALVAYVRSLAK